MHPQVEGDARHPARGGSPRSRQPLGRRMPTIECNARLYLASKMMIKTSPDVVAVCLPESCA